MRNILFALVFAMLSFVAASCSNDSTASTNVDTVDMSSYGFAASELTGTYSSSSRSISLSSDSGMVAGGVLIYIALVSDLAMDDPNTPTKCVPVTEYNGKAYFDTEPGEAYFVFLNFFITGPNSTGIDGQCLAFGFTAQDEDVLSFYVNSSGAGVYINGIQCDTNVVFAPTSTSAYTNDAARTAAMYTQVEALGGASCAGVFTVAE